MQISLTDNLTVARDAVIQALVMVKGLDTSGNASERSLAIALSPLLQTASAKLEEASVTASKEHVLFALSPDAFNPFVLPDIRRGYCRFALDDKLRTMLVMKSIVDEDPDEELPLHTQLSHWIVTYTVYDDVHSDSFILHGHDALTTYKNDEADVKNHTSWLGPIISNYKLRSRLNQAVPTPCAMNIKSIAALVKDTVDDLVPKPDVTTRSWFTPNKTFVLDIVSILALSKARERRLEVPGVGHVKDLVREDTMTRYFGVETF